MDLEQVILNTSEQDKSKEKTSWLTKTMLGFSALVLFGLIYTANAEAIDEKISNVFLGDETESVSELDEDTTKMCVEQYVEKQEKINESLNSGQVQINASVSEIIFFNEQTGKIETNKPCFKEFEVVEVDGKKICNVVTKPCEITEQFDENTNTNTVTFSIDNVSAIGGYEL